MFFFNEASLMQGLQGQWYMVPVLCPGNCQFYPNFPSVMVNGHHVGFQSPEIAPQKGENEIQNKNQNSNFQEQKIERKDKFTLGRSSKKEKIMKIGNVVKQDEEFQPHATAEKGKKRTPQNLNRNVFPNIVHQIFSFLQKKSKSQTFVQRLLQAQKEKSIGSVKRFYLYQSLIKDKMHHYVNIQSLQIFAALQDPKCQLYPLEEQYLYIRMSRMLIDTFLKKEFQCIILTSKRVSSDKKFHHLQYRRKLLEYIQSIYIK